MKIIWLSANRLGYELLKEALTLEGVKIDSIITLSKQSGTIMYDGIGIKKWYNLGLKVFEVERINNEHKLFKDASPDLVIMCGWRQKVDKSIIEIPRQGFIGFHPTLLPKGRGPAPIINSILEGMKESGVTMFYVDGGLDSGDIIGQEYFLIEESDYAGDVYNKVIMAGKKLIDKYLPLLIKKEAHRKAQDDSKATFFKKLTLKDNEINLDSESVNYIYRKVRAFSRPYKGAYIKIKREGKKQKLIIWEIEVEI